MSTIYRFFDAPALVSLCLTFGLDIEPKGKGRPRGVVLPVNAARASGLQFKGKNVRIGAKPDPKSEAWEVEAKLRMNLVANANRGGGLLEDLWEAPIWVGLLLQYKRPKSVKMSEVWASSKSIDNDNAEKAVWDAMNGIFYEDDHRIVMNTTAKIWTDGDPSILVSIGRINNP